MDITLTCFGMTTIIKKIVVINLGNNISLVPQLLKPSSEINSKSFDRVSTRKKIIIYSVLDHTKQTQMRSISFIF